MYFEEKSYIDPQKKENYDKEKWMTFFNDTLFLLKVTVQYTIFPAAEGIKVHKIEHKRPCI